MAATGLLGINPYFKGVSIDTSKPVNLAIQLQQKEQAKKEALDKSFMDYEKSINPAGMRKQEGDIFLQKLAENKAFYLQNRDKILNPARYGYDAQSQYMANNKGLLSLIDQSKQAAANDKVAQQHFMAQKGLNAPDGYKTDLELSRLPVTDPNYKPLDITRHRFYENLDPIKYANKIYSKIPLSESAPQPLPVKGMPGYFYTKTTSKVSPEYKNAILNEGYTNYANDEGLRKGINEIFDTNKAEVKRLEDKYGTRIPDAQALAGIYTWDLQPIKESTTGAIESGASKEARAKRNIDYSNQNQSPTTHLFDIFGSGTGISSPNIDIKDGTATAKKDGSLYSGNIVVKKEQLPSDFSAALSSAGISKNDIEGTDFLTINYKNGKAESISSELLGKIDANQMARYQDALNKKIYGIKGAITRTTAVPRTSDKASTGKVIKTAQFLEMSLADRQKFLSSGGTHSK